jgi:hypothetical protein
VWTAKERPGQLHKPGQRFPVLEAPGKGQITMTYVDEARIYTFSSKAVQPKENTTFSTLLSELREHLREDANNAILKNQLDRFQDLWNQTSLKNQELKEEIQELKEEVQELKEEIQEQKEALQSVFCNSAATLEAMTVSMKEQDVMRGKEFEFFMEKVKKAVENGDTNLILAYVRQGIAKTDRAIHDWVPSTKALTNPKKPRLVAVSKIVLRATQIKEYTEEHGAKSITSREARRYLAGIEGVEPNRRDTIRALRRARKMLPGFVLEVYNGMWRLVCRDRGKRPVREDQTNVEDKSSVEDKTIDPDYIFNAVPEKATADHDSKSRGQWIRSDLKGGMIETVSRLIQPRHDKAL